MTRSRRRMILALIALVAFTAALSPLVLRQSVAPPILPDLSAASKVAIAAILREAKLAEADPRTAQLRGNLACVLLAHQFDSAAAVEFRIASELDPQSFRWKYLQGLAEVPDSRSRAMDCFRRAATLHTDSWLPRLRLAELLMAENQPQAASEPIADSRRLAPNELRPALAEIRLQLLQQQPAAALALAEQLRSTGFRVRDLSELYAAALFQLGRSQEARAAALELQDESLEPAGWNDPFAASVLAFSTDPADLITEARSHAIAGEYPQAITRLKAAHGRAADHPDYFPTLVRLLLENGQATEAVRVADEGLKRLPGSPLLLHLRGSSLLLLGQIADAERCFREALQLKPDLALARLNLAHCLLKSTGRRAAIPALEETLRTTPEMRPARLLLASLLLDEDRLVDAAEQLQKLQQLLPPDHAELRQLQSRLTQRQSHTQPSSSN
jgi:tetratricopeptide (TPR) repeat protein